MLTAGCSDDDSATAAGPPGAIECGPGSWARRGAEVRDTCLGEDVVLACTSTGRTVQDEVTCAVYVSTGKRYLVHQTPFVAAGFRACTADEYASAIELPSCAAAAGVR